MIRNVPVKPIRQSESVFHNVLNPHPISIRLLTINTEPRKNVSIIRGGLATPVFNALRENQLGKVTNYDLSYMNTATQTKPARDYKKKYKDMVDKVRTNELIYLDLKK